MKKMLRIWELTIKWSLSVILLRKQPIETNSEALFSMGSNAG